MAHDDERKMSVPVLAGLAAACDPFLVFFTGLLLTEALFAAVLAGKLDVAGKRVGVTISGGNIGLDRYLHVMSGGQ